MAPDEKSREEEPQSSAEYRRGLPDHHDPTAGIGGAPPAYSALTFRLVLAVFGALIGLTALVVGAVISHLVLLILGALLTIVATLNAIVIAVRKRRGEPG